MYFHLRKTTLIFLIALLSVSGCGFRSSHPVKMRTSTATLKEATLDQLVESINTNAEKLKTLKAENLAALKTLKTGTFQSKCC